MQAIINRFIPTKISLSVRNIQNNTKSLFLRMKGYKPNVEIYIENSRFIIKTIPNSKELIEVLKMRYEVLYKEFLGIDTSLEPNRIEVDKYDTLFDHLAIIDKNTNKPVGTYRLNCTKYNRILYAADEFDMTSIDKLDGYKVEMGRACVHPDYRNGAIISSLWKGLGAYVNATKSRYMFGCASVITKDPFQVFLISKWLEKYNSEEYKGVLPNERYRNESLEWAIDNNMEQTFVSETEEAVKLVPPLLMTYLKSGGCICGKPAHNKSFNCYDFLTLVDKETMEPSYHHKFFE